MSQEPIPCPFCGQLPELTKHFKHDAWGLMHRCPVVGPISFEFGDRQRHVATWNHRTPGPATAAMVAWAELAKGKVGVLWGAHDASILETFLAEHEPA